MAVSSFDIDAPRWDQSTFMGRLKHFFNITDWRTAALPDSRLDEAKALVESCRAGSIPPGTTEEQLHYAKKLYDSAFHPDTGDRMNLIGRMSFQVPGGMAITGFMLQFYRTVPAVVFWQWVNQSFNALVNYTNRNAASPITPKEILNGIAVTDENGNKLGHSKKAAAKGITQVVVSRITMAAPGMVILPIIMERLENYKFMKRITFLHGPIQVMLVGGFLIFMVPAACSLFPQQCSMAVSKLEPELRDSIASQYGDSVQRVYFNKGL
ncbi:sideroflexin-2 isoform X2 [Embiotoca jacksoni]|uniref:sideroflexin-2 isoform X2 n=1 Tax=Embiotoca jacksoni TaxID=100190 RepID=UPI003703E121